MGGSLGGRTRVASVWIYFHFFLSTFPPQLRTLLPEHTADFFAEQHKRRAFFQGGVLDVWRIKSNFNQYTGLIVSQNLSPQPFFGEPRLNEIYFLDASASIRFLRSKGLLGP